MPPTDTATAAMTDRLSRRRRAQAAIVAAHARRDPRKPQQMTTWLAGCLVGLAAGPMSDHDIAETVRGLAAGWAQIQGTEQAAERGMAHPTNQRTCPGCGAPQFRIRASFNWFHAASGVEACAAPELTR